MEPIGGEGLLYQCSAHARWRRIRGFQASYLSDQPVLHPALHVQIERNVGWVSINEEKDLANSRSSPRRRIESMDQLRQSTNVIFIVMRESNYRNLADTDGVQPIGEAIPIRSDIDEGSLKLSWVPTRQRIDDRQTIALSHVQAVNADIQVFPLSFRFQRPRIWVMRLDARNSVPRSLAICSVSRIRTFCGRFEPMHPYWKLQHHALEPVTRLQNAEVGILVVPGKGSGLVLDTLRTEQPMDLQGAKWRGVDDTTDQQPRRRVFPLKLLPVDKVVHDSADQVVLGPLGMRWDTNLLTNQLVKSSFQVAKCGILVRTNALNGED